MEASKPMLCKTPGCRNAAKWVDEDGKTICGDCRKKHPGRSLEEIVYMDKKFKINW